MLAHNAPRKLMFTVQNCCLSEKVALFADTISMFKTVFDSYYFYESPFIRNMLVKSTLIYF